MIVEIPQGSRNKYEMNHETGEIWLDRTLFTATQYPLDYGFFPNTLGEDGDAPDFLLAEIANFFEVYKLIEPGKESTVGAWADAAAAEAEITAAITRHQH